MSPYSIHNVRRLSQCCEKMAPQGMYTMWRARTCIAAPCLQARAGKQDIRTMSLLHHFRRRVTLMNSLGFAVTIQRSLLVSYSYLPDRSHQNNVHISVLPLPTSISIRTAMPSHATYSGRGRGHGRREDLRRHNDGSCDDESHHPLRDYSRGHRLRWSSGRQMPSKTRFAQRAIRRRWSIV